VTIALPALITGIEPPARPEAGLLVGNKTRVDGYKRYSHSASGFEKQAKFRQCALIEVGHPVFTTKTRRHEDLPRSCLYEPSRLRVFVV